MMLIIRAAYFQISEDFMRGRVVPTISYPSPWVYCQDFGFYLVESYLKFGAIIEAEAGNMENVIRDWHPPIRRYDIDFYRQAPEFISFADVLTSPDPIREFYGNQAAVH